MQLKIKKPQIQEIGFADTHEARMKQLFTNITNEFLDKVLLSLKILQVTMIIMQKHIQNKSDNYF